MTTSWTFMMATLLAAPPVASVVISAAVVLIGDLVSRKPLIELVLDSARIVVSLSLGAAVLVVAGQDQALRPHSAPPVLWFPAFVVAGGVVFVVNNAVTCTAIARHQDLPAREVLRSMGLMSLSTDGVLLSLSPVFVVVAQRSVLLVPLLLVTTWTVYRTAQIALARRHDATHDPLTQLPNRRMFDEYLHDAIVSAERTGARVGVVLVDLNGFKGINDRLGHDIGDQVLTSVAARMNAARRPSDLLARLGGDEFAIVVTRLDTVDTARAVADRIGSTFAEPCTVAGFPVSIDASLGVAVLPDHAHDSETLLRRADETMYSAKHHDERVHVYETRRAPQALGRIALLADVADALSGDEFFLEYQPQISLSSGTAIGAEALIRWRHPVEGVLYPSEFIGLAEQTDLIGPITERVLRHALEQSASWRRAGLDLRVAVNISARNMQDLRFPDLVGSLIRETGARPADIDLEITENTKGLDRSTVQEVLKQLRKIGVSLSIDDFGTGYGSMAHLRELPVDRIKIDRSFVSNMALRRPDAVIVRTILQLGQALGMETIAEGVEDAVVARMLAELGCTTAQGWHYGKPMAPEALGRHLWTPSADAPVPVLRPVRSLGRATAPDPGGPLRPSRPLLPDGAVPAWAGEGRLLIEPGHPHW